MIDRTDLLTTESFDDLRLCDRALIVLTPRLSIYPRIVLRKLDELQDKLAELHINQFTCTEDEIGMNPLMEQWIARYDGQPHDLKVMFLGSGTIILATRGKPTHILQSPSSLESDDILDWVRKAFA